MPRASKNKLSDTQLGLFDLNPVVKTVGCVPTLRELVADWQADGYKGITNTTRALLNFWFFTDQRQPNGQLFTYHRSQREAIETLIYVYEVARVRTRKDLLEQFSRKNVDLRLASYDEFARYCVKMATGACKTKVMSRAVVWQ